MRLLIKNINPILFTFCCLFIVSDTISQCLDAYAYTSPKAAYAYVADVPNIEITYNGNTHETINISVPNGEIRIFDRYEGDIMYNGYIIRDGLYYTFSGLYNNNNDSDIIVTLEFLFLHVFENDILPYDVDHRMSDEGMTHAE